MKIEKKVDVVLLSIHPVCQYEKYHHARVEFTRTGGKPPYEYDLPPLAQPGEPLPWVCSAIKVPNINIEIENSERKQRLHLYMTKQ